MSKRLLYSTLLCASVISISCNNSINSEKTAGTVADTLTSEQIHKSANALKGLVAFEGLEVSTIATEPMLQNPTNIDVDDRGRIWVTEAYNYRPDINGNPTNAKGDRIMILEDTNNDGIADTAKVFYQGPELNAPLGICVLGNRVIVSQSPYVWSFYDDNGDDKADRKEILFQGIGGEQHDHGAHAFTFGPDGKLYFNFGNEGRTLKDKNGHTVRDQDGDEITPKKYKEGMVMRCNPDGSAVEVLGQNFRNPYEVAVDSYGTLWQSDNDDDGNRGVRINYVMEHGNYGYKDEMTNASWQQTRTNLEDSIPLRHWHLNDPGAVPNLLQTFAGSPTGIVVYEGALLPEAFRNQLIHTDAGPNVVRSYPVKKNGAGYTAEIINILKGENDQWFRPADVCVAPDGSLIIADWYDPGVGGHQAGDQTKGRIYRVAPVKSKYSVATQNYTSPEGAVQALQNPNLSVRYKAFTALQSMGAKAIPELEKLWNTSPNPKMRARAFWVLQKMNGADKVKYTSEALQQKIPELKIIALRATKELKGDVIGLVKLLSNDADMQVRRECALALHHNKSAEAPALWAALATSYDGKDRWFLEALGIGADQQWDAYFKAFVDKVKDPNQNAAFRDIVWRARTDKAVPYLAKLAVEETIPLANRLKYFRAFDFNPGPAKSALLLAMIKTNSISDTSINKLALHHLDVKAVKASPVAQQALKDILKTVAGTAEFIDLVRKYELKTKNNELLLMALEKSNEPEGRSATDVLLKAGGAPLIWNLLNDEDSVKSNALLTSLSRVGNSESLNMLQTIVVSKKYAPMLRKQAAGKIGNSGGGEDLVLALLKNKTVPEFLIPDVVASVQGAWRKAVRTEASGYLPNATTNAAIKEPTVAELAVFKPVAANGKTVFSNKCAVCHQVNKEGYDFGPNLTEIGNKYPKEGLLETILHPSNGISFGYESWEIKLKDGSSTTGIINSKTETDLELKLPGGGRQQLKMSDVKSITALKVSMMPDGLHQTMSSQELADLLAYLKDLTKK